MRSETELYPFHVFRFNIENTTRAIVEEFSFFDDWMQRYEYIIELGKTLQGLPEHKKDDTHKVPGCQSQVWFYAREDEGRIHYDADQDAMIAGTYSNFIACLFRSHAPQK